MKWMKHMTATTDDEKIARLLGDGGEAGRARYGTYWMINEIIAAQMDGTEPSCSVSYPVSVWSRRLVSRPSLVWSLLSKLAVTGVVTVEWDGSDIRVTNRNLLKYRDEYARKSGHSPDKLPARTEGEGDTELEGEQKKQEPLASSANALPADKGKLLGTLPLNDGTDWEVWSGDADELQPLYPAVDVRQELRNMKGWLIGNPTLRKTKRGIKRFVTSWLSKEQDKARPHGGTNGKPQRIDAIRDSHQGAIDLLPGMDRPAYLGGGSAQAKPAARPILEGAHGPVVAGHS